MHENACAGCTAGKIRFLGAMSVSLPQGGVAPGLSGLAWSEDEQLLYALSDFGRLYVIKPLWNQQGHLTGNVVLGHWPLLDKQGKALSGSLRDAEGLAIAHGNDGRRGNEQLLVSFERTPRLIWYNPAGHWLKEESLPAALNHITHYRNANKALEAVMLDGKGGWLTGPEHALNRDPDDIIGLYDAQRRRYNYPLSANDAKTSLVALEPIGNGDILTIERSWLPPIGPLVIRLRQAALTQPQMRVDTLLEMRSDEGWVLDNFEGLTHHQGRRFFMVSDNNDNRLQQTILVYFELLQD